MKQLLLVRHATAEPENFQKMDFERELTAHGVSEAEKLAAYMAQHHCKPGFILHSPAKRTTQTAGTLVKTLPGCATGESITLYNANFAVLMSALNGLKHASDVVALVAHNPGISQMATALSDSKPYQLAPAAAVLFSFPCATWQEVKAGMGKELWYFYP